MERLRGMLRRGMAFPQGTALHNCLVVGLLLCLHRPSTAHAQGLYRSPTSPAAGLTSQSGLLTSASVAPIKDLRITTYEDLLLDISIRVYHHNTSRDYSRLVVDIPRNQLILGAKNQLLRLDAKSLRSLQTVEWTPKEMEMKVCQAKGQSLQDCQNYIRVLILQEDQIFVCGTSAFSPQCSWRPANDLAVVDAWIPGVAKCPYDPQHNNTAVMTSEGSLYSATVTDFTSRDPAIYRMLGPSKPLRTVQYNSRWLNEPEFISSYEIGDFIYFFFRESAVEYINCGKNIYSRVARICKRDTGGNFLLEDNWTTFVKARLNCSLPGKYPFYFNEIQASYYLEEEHMIYAVFTTSPTSIYGTAICTFNMSAFDESFNGPFKYQEGSQMAWSRVPNTSPFQCGGQSDGKRPLEKSFPNTTPRQRLLLDAQKYQIMDQAVEPINQRPLLVAENERYTHIAVDTVITKHHQKFTVLFVATLEGVVKKLVQLPGQRQMCVVEQIHILPEQKVGAVRSFELSKEEAALFVGTEDRVYRVPIQRCDRFTSKVTCLSAQDPYCGWNSDWQQCTTVPKTLPAHNWHQNISSCPILQYPVNGGWSLWGAWEPCEQLGYPRGGDQCMCRRRTCSQPEPVFGGEDCWGRSVEVSNCTVNGGWSQWSPWSGCSATCDVAVRSRHRTCGNPEPQYGGRVCVGSARDEEYCYDNPECPPDPPIEVPVDGGWSAWGHWSPCDRACQGGVQTRKRACTNPPVLWGGHDCAGNDEQWRRCNKHACEEVRRSSDWTPWIKVNVTKDGHFEERFRFVCKANVEASDELRISQPKTDFRFCSASNPQDCLKPGELSVGGRPGDDGEDTPTEAALRALCAAHSAEGTKGDSVHRPPAAKHNGGVDGGKGNEIIKGSRKGSGSGRRKNKGNKKNKAKYSGKHNDVIISDAGAVTPEDARMVRSPIWQHKKTYTGFCGCRDLGMMRMCRRCTVPLS